MHRLCERGSWEICGVLFACVLLFAFFVFASELDQCITSCMVRTERRGYVKMQGALCCLIRGLSCWTEHSAVGLIN